MDHLGPGDIQHPQIFETGDATHVVIAVEYGADTIYVFDCNIGSSKDQHEVSGNLKAVMNLFIIGIEGENSSLPSERYRARTEEEIF